MTTNGNAHRMGLALLLIAALLMGLRILSKRQANQALDAPADVGTSSPTKEYTEIKVSFEVEDVFPPPLPEYEENDAIRVYFTLQDFDPPTNTYSKTVSADRIKLATLEANLAANNYSAYRLCIVDPRKEGWAFFGRVTVEYGDEPNRTVRVDEKHRVWGVASASR